MFFKVTKMVYVDLDQITGIHVKSGGCDIHLNGTIMLARCSDDESKRLKEAWENTFK